MYFHIKKQIQLVIFFLGLTGLVWWALLCKMNFDSFFDIPLLHLLPYLLFSLVNFLSLYTWVKIFRMEKNIIHIKESLEKR